MIRLKVQVYLFKKCCKQEYSKEALSWYNFNPKGIIIFPHDEKQIILLTSMRNDNHELQYTGKKKIPKHNTIWEKQSLITVDDTGQTQ